MPGNGWNIGKKWRTHIIEEPEPSYQKIQEGWLLNDKWSRVDNGGTRVEKWFDKEQKKCFYRSIAAGPIQISGPIIGSPYQGDYSQLAQYVWIGTISKANLPSAASIRYTRGSSNTDYYGRNLSISIAITNTGVDFKNSLSSDGASSTRAFPSSVDTVDVWISYRGTSGSHRFINTRDDPVTSSLFTNILFELITSTGVVLASQEVYFGAPTGLVSVPSERAYEFCGRTNGMSLQGTESFTQSLAISDGFGGFSLLYTNKDSETLPDCSSSGCQSMCLTGFSNSPDTPGEATISFSYNRGTCATFYNVPASVRATYRRTWPIPPGKVYPSGARAGFDISVLSSVRPIDCL